MFINSDQECSVGLRCFSGTCIDEACLPGEPLCVGQRIAICLPDGTGPGTPAACSSGSQCAVVAGTAACTATGSGGTTGAGGSTADGGDTCNRRFCPTTGAATACCLGTMCGLDFGRGCISSVMDGGTGGGTGSGGTGSGGTTSTGGAGGAPDASATPDGSAPRDASIDVASSG